MKGRFKFTSIRSRRLSITCHLEPGGMPAITNSVVHEAAEAVLPGKRRGLAVGRFAVGSSGESTSQSWVFISAVWRELRSGSDPLCAGMSLEKFKEELLKVHEHKDYNLAGGKDALGAGP